MVKVRTSKKCNSCVALGAQASEASTSKRTMQVGKGFVAAKLLMEINVGVLSCGPTELFSSFSI